MNQIAISDIGVVNVAVMPWALDAAGPVAPAAHHPAAAAHHAMTAIKRRTATATVASVHRGTT